MPSADELPLELLITVLSFLHDVRAIAVCACVSRQWRKAAAQAVPRDVILHGFIKEEMSSLLLRKPLRPEHCGGHASNLPSFPRATGTVDDRHPLCSYMHRGYSAQGGLHVSLILKPHVACSVPQPHTSAHPLCRVDHYIDVDVNLRVSLLPVNLKHLSCDTPEKACPDLAQLSRLTQLKQLKLQESLRPLTQPLPQLPALQYLQVWTDLQTVSSVASTLQELNLYARDINFRQPVTLALFTRLHTLSLAARTIRNFTPEVLPPNLCCVTIIYKDHEPFLDADQVLTFPAGGHTVKSMDYGQHVVTWTHQSLL